MKAERCIDFTQWVQKPISFIKFQTKLLQPGGLRKLQKLGLGSCVESIDAQPCYGYHITYRDEDVLAPYPLVDSEGKVVSTPDSNLGSRYVEEHHKPPYRILY